MDILKVVVIVLVVVGLLWLVPLLMIWSINTLFNTGIPYTLSTWFAAFVLTSAVTSKVKS